MFYHYFRVFNWISTLIGMRKPFLDRSGNPCKIPLISKLWSLCLVIILIIIHQTLNITYVTIYFIRVVRINDLLIDISTILMNSFCGERDCVHIYTKFHEVFNDFRISERNIKMLTMKLYFWISLFYVFMLSVAAQGVVGTTPWLFSILRIPNMLAFTHLVVHLYVVLVILKALNSKLRNKLCIQDINENSNEKFKEIRYFLNVHAMFIDADNNDNFDISFLCKVYNKLNTCVQLLEKHHSVQILISIWILFSRAVIGLTIIVTFKKESPVSIEVIISFLPFFWTFIGCYISDQLRKEVEQTEIIIVKHLIDFRCNPVRRSMLKIFKQSVQTNRLQFTACSLFSLSYSMLLNTFMNVITYSIILIQLFLNQSEL